MTFHQFPTVILALTMLINERLLDEAYLETVGTPRGITSKLTFSEGCACCVGRGRRRARAHINMKTVYLDADRSCLLISFSVCDIR